MKDNDTDRDHNKVGIGKRTYLFNCLKYSDLKK